MSPIPKRKLCWQCEGNCDFEDDNCPYCGVYLHPEGAETHHEEHTFTPPYKIPLADEQLASEETVKPQTVAQTSSIAFVKPLLFLLLGSTLSVFAFILLLFNHNGYFTLQWNADIWYVYLLVSVPLLWGGWRTLHVADRDDV